MIRSAFYRQPCLLTQRCDVVVVSCKPKPVYCLKVALVNSTTMEIQLREHSHCLYVATISGPCKPILRLFYSTKVNNKHLGQVHLIVKIEPTESCNWFKTVVMAKIADTTTIIIPITVISGVPTHTATAKVAVASSPGADMVIVVSNIMLH